MDRLPETLMLDGEALVLDKPAGLPVDAPRAGGPSVEALLPDLRFGFARAPSPVHRLDRDTSGCLLLARNAGALKRFQAAFEARAVRKLYLAVVDGVPDADAGSIELALAKRSTPADGWRMVPHPKGKAASTRWQRLDTVAGRTLMLLQPHTGRTHQLRVHLASGLGLPITGDSVYGQAHGNGLMLHAWQLHMPRGTKPPVDVRAPLPQRFLAMGFAEPATNGDGLHG